MRITSKTLVALVALLALQAVSDIAHAAESLKDQLADFTTDLALPASPAAAHVGLSQESVLMPRNRRAFEAGLSKLMNDDGKFVGAIEVSPFYMFRGQGLEYAKYRDDFWYRALTKTSLGAASGKRSIESKELTANGYSISTVLLDLGDPVFSHALQACINRVQANSLARVKAAETKKAQKAEDLPATDTKEPFTAADEREDPEALTEYKACITKREPELWNRTRVSLGIASGSGREVAGAKRRIDFGDSVWFSAQYGFEGFDVLKRVFGQGDRFIDCADGKAGEKCSKYRTPDRLEQNAMATFHVRHVRGASDLDLSAQGALSKQQNTLAALRLTYGSDKRNIFVETSRSWVKIPGSTKRLEQHAFGGSFQVREGIWVNVVNGRRKSFLNGALDNVTELNLQFGWSKDPVIESPKPKKPET
jgi:hypothetical protein